jgi:hypothetical protein
MENNKYSSLDLHNFIKVHAANRSALVIVLENSLTFPKSMQSVGLFIVFSNGVPFTKSMRSVGALSVSFSRST